MDSNTDKEGSGSVAEREQKLTTSDMREGGQEAGVEDKRNGDENSAKVEPINSLIQMDSNLSRMDKQGSVAGSEPELNKSDLPKVKLGAGSEDQTQFPFHVVFPYLSRWRNITFRETLDWRRVCKSWKDVIDSTLSTKPMDFNFHAHLDLKRREYDHGREFHTLAHLKHFNLMRKQKYSRTNPFPFRKLYIGSMATLLEGFTLGLPYWEEMEELLDRWGKEIWVVSYGFEKGSIEMMYKQLLKYLNLMPNLRELNIFERDRSQNLGTDILRSLEKDVLGPLKEAMELEPLPELPHLHTIIFTQFTPSPLIKAALTKYGATLQSVRIEASGIDKYSGEYQDPGEFVVGRELPFTKYSCVYTDSSRINHWKFQFPKLSELLLTYLDATDGPEVENIFSTVNSCGSSVRRLLLMVCFNLPGPQDVWRDRLPTGMKLDLPHLQTLELNLGWSKVSNVDYLLPLKSLEELRFTYVTSDWGMPDVDGDGIIQFVGYRDRMYDSNIWILLPKLKRITIISMPKNQPSEQYKMTSVHTRDRYRQYQENPRRIHVTHMSIGPIVRSLK